MVIYSRYRLEVCGGLCFDPRDSRLSCSSFVGDPGFSLKLSRRRGVLDFIHDAIKLRGVSAPRKPEGKSRHLAPHGFGCLN